MYSVVLQDWVTIRGNSSVLSVTQGENGWVGTAAYEDIVIWADVREVTSASATTMVLNFQTSPLKEDFLFQNMVTGVNLLSLGTQPSVTKVLLSQNPTVPLARWVRWNLTLTGSPSGSWDCTFRIIAACNAVSSLANG